MGILNCPFAWPSSSPLSHFAKLSDNELSTSPPSTQAQLPTYYAKRTTSAYITLPMPDTSDSTGALQCAAPVAVGCGHKQTWCLGYRGHWCFVLP
eukprot:199824-Rhodomonas_salina.1